jgi:DUF4097 and DUF4098 domain-containing protein YvlB
MKTRVAGSKNVLTENLSEPLNGATTAKVEINTESGNLTIDGLTGGEPILASGTLEYSEKLGPPTRILNSRNCQVNLKLQGKDPGKHWLHFPWAACNGATDWNIHLNPMVSFEIIAFSGGGNLKLNLDGMDVTNVLADTGGGKIDVVLPDNVANLNVAAKSGAGNVDVHVPSGIEARIHASSGLGKVSVDSRFNEVAGNTYQSFGYDSAANKVEITAKTGVGDVNVSIKQ